MLWTTSQMWKIPTLLTPTDMSTFTTIWTATTMWKPRATLTGTATTNTRKVQATWTRTRPPARLERVRGGTRRWCRGWWPTWSSPPCQLLWTQSWSQALPRYQFAIFTLEEKNNYQRWRWSCQPSCSHRQVSSTLSTTWTRCEGDQQPKQNFKKSFQDYDFFFFQVARGRLIVVRLKVLVPVCS